MAFRPSLDLKLDYVHQSGVPWLDPHILSEYSTCLLLGRMPHVWSGWAGLEKQPEQTARGLAGVLWARGNWQQLSGTGRDSRSG